MEAIVMSDHHIIHIELPAENGKEASEFYNEAFGWNAEDWRDSGFYMFSFGNEIGGGFNKLTDEGNIPVKPGEVLVYISTDDIDDSLAKVESLGGKTLLPRTAADEMGWYAFFADPTGNRVGLWQSVPMPAQAN
jgi:predicted enzyme related to lactoylglutathione lyase